MTKQQCVDQQATEPAFKAMDHQEFLLALNEFFCEDLGYSLLDEDHSDFFIDIPRKKRKLSNVKPLSDVEIRRKLLKSATKKELINRLVQGMSSDNAAEVGQGSDVTRLVILRPPLPNQRVDMKVTLTSFILWYIYYIFVDKLTC